MFNWNNGSKSSSLKDYNGSNPLSFTLLAYVNGVWDQITYIMYWRNNWDLLNWPFQYSPLCSRILVFNMDLWLQINLGSSLLIILFREVLIKRPKIKNTKNRVK